MKVAIVHDWLTTFAGAEIVLEKLLDIFPESEIFTIVDFLPKKDRKFLKENIIHTSFIQKAPFSKTKYRSYLPLMPFAIEQFDLSGFDLVISSSHAVAKSVITAPDQIHICYMHSPMRYAWDLQSQYLNAGSFSCSVKGIFAKMFLHKLRIWDAISSNRVDYFIANSNFVKSRIYKFYRRKSTVIHPPVDISSIPFSEKKEDYYITVSRLVSYKKIDLIVSAFKEMPEKKLKVIGSGPDFKKVKDMSSNLKNIEVLGFVEKNEMNKLVSQAKAFVFASIEDFGIAPVEAMASGTPVLAFKKGGALDTVIEGVNGMFFDEQNTNSIINCVNKFEAVSISSYSCREESKKFSDEVFKGKMIRFIDQCL